MNTYLSMKLLWCILGIIVGVSSLHTDSWISGPDESPFLATVYVSFTHFNGKMYTWNGAIINERFVLTLTHRFLEAQAENPGKEVRFMIVYAGTDDWYDGITQSSTDGQEYMQKRYVQTIHNIQGFETVQLARRTAYRNNLAMLQLREPFQFSSVFVTPIPIRNEPLNTCVISKAHSWRRRHYRDYGRGYVQNSVLGRAACVDMDVPLVENEFCAQNTLMKGHLTELDYGSPVVVDGMLLGIIVDTHQKNGYGPWVLLQIRPYADAIQGIINANP